MGYKYSYLTYNPTTTTLEPPSKGLGFIRIVPGASQFRV